MKKTPPLAWLLLVLMALVWGSSFILMKKSLEVYSVIELGAGRLVMAFLFFIPFIFKSKNDIPKDRYPYLLASGLIGYIIPAFIFALAGSKLNSSLSGMLNSLSPLWTLIIGILLFNQPKKGFQIAGILLGLFGAGLLIFSKDTGNLNIVNPYALLIVAATSLYGLNTNNIVRNLNMLPPIGAAAFTFLFIGPICLTILFFTDFFSKALDIHNWHSTGYLVLLGLLGSGITSILYNKTVQLTSGLFASSVTYIMPIIAVIWGVLDDEKITVQHFVGMGIILTGIYLINKK